MYIGLLGDGETSCLKLMIATLTREVRDRVPRSLEGYAVVLEETGEIRPLRRPE